ncbi:hypothetical protein M9435_001522 [Picochlorum sp. BPE23]|nr:hypothetical protein M9435_001522 [Picochlorum sp. BPE23]
MGKRDAAGRFESMRLYMYQQSEDDTISGTSSLHGEGGAKLFSAELDGRSFERIRREEKLLVEYQQFLQNVVCLFEQAYAWTDCSRQGLQSVPYQTLDHGTTNQAASQTESRQKFRIVLHIAGHGQCKLEFLECNAFRELAHLTLSLQANSDAGMNSFLLFRLREIMEENETLLSTIETLRRDGDAVREQLTAVHHQRSADTNQYSTETSSLKIQCDMLKSQVSNANDQCELLKNKLHDLESTNLSLHKELSSKEQDMESLREQTKRLNDTIESYKRNSVSAEEITSQSSREISRLKELCEGYKCASDMADARVDDWKRMSKTHEKQSQERAEKIKALEEKIAQLSRDAAHANQELHDIQARSHQREDLMQTQEEALKSAQERVTDLQQNNKKLEQQLETVQKKLELAQKQEKESVQKAQNNEKMIVWLNKQLTSIQLKTPPPARSNKPHVTPQPCGDIKTPVSVIAPPTATSRLAATSVNRGG